MPPRAQNSSSTRWTVLRWTRREAGSPQRRRRELPSSCRTQQRRFEFGISVVLASFSSLYSLLPALFTTFLESLHNACSPYCHIVVLGGYEAELWCRADYLHRQCRRFPPLRCYLLRFLVTCFVLSEDLYASGRGRKICARPSPIAKRTGYQNFWNLCRTQRQRTKAK